MYQPVKSVLDLIGNTPLLQVMNIDTGCCKLFLKLESQNPGGSIKDRPAKFMIEDAEKNGKLALELKDKDGIPLINKQKQNQRRRVIKDKVDSFIFPHDNKKLTQFCAFHFHWEDIKAVYRKDEDGKWGYTYIVNKNKKSFK